MFAFAEIGFITTALGLIATSIAEGAIVGGFVMTGARMVRRQSRPEMEGNALRDSFWGGVWGIACLCMDLLVQVR